MLRGPVWRRSSQRDVPSSDYFGAALRGFAESAIETVMMRIFNKVMPRHGATSQARNAQFLFARLGTDST